MKNFDAFIEDLKTLISFNTEEASPKENMPFGENLFNTLNFVLSKAKDFGFKTINYDNYAGEITVGEGEEIGIIGHLDVVPAGDGWDFPPYKLTKKDGIYYGRGIMDDKMPTLMQLYALKELKEENVKFNKKIRLFLGTNEETSWKDIEYLKKKTKLPEYGFSPDGDFPLSFAEKGILIVEFKIPKLKRFHNIKGGTVINAVCGRAEVIADSEGINEKSLFTHGLMLKENGKIESVGVSCHGSSPRQGKNALLPLFEYFYDCGEDVKNVLDYLFYDKAKIFDITTEQGNVTLSPDLIEEKEDYISIKCDCRFPYPIKVSELKKIFDTFGIRYSAQEKHPTQYVDKNGEFIETLISTYNEITGQNLKPIAIGGSTFARVFNKGVSFGPEIYGKKGVAHQPNECVSEEDMLKIYDIYKSAIYNLIK